MAQLKEITFATCNLYNLNIPGMPIYTDENGWTIEEYKKKIAWTSNIIKTLHADVFGFQELWHADALIEAFTDADLHEEYNLLIPENCIGERIHCAAAIKKGLIEGTPEWITNFPEKFILHSSGDDPQTPSILINIDSFSRPVLNSQ